MIEKLFPLNLPAGFVNNGTTYQSKGRWFTGSLVRFFQGTIQPIGGWTKRTLTGAAILGVPNAAVSWQTNDGSSFIGIGTSSSLYIVDVNNVVYDVLAVGLAGFPTGSARWQLAVFGSYLIAAYNKTAYNFADSLNVLAWKGDTTLKAVQIGQDPVTGVGHQTPISVFGVVSTPERFLVLLRGSDANGAARRAPTGGAVFDPTTGLVIDSSLNGAPVPEGGSIISQSGSGGNSGGSDTGGGGGSLIIA